MPTIYLVNHPGREVDVSTKKPSGFCCCNTTRIHCRKFMKHNGDYLDDENMLQTNKSLMFWGEYECRSEFELLPRGVNSDYDHPIACHTPLYPNQDTQGLNTDPFIFGKEFYYHCCKIGRHRYQSGDMVLFGTVFKSSDFEFHLDTLIIIDSQVSVSDISPSSSFRKCNPDADIIYKGKMYNGNNIELFSFVPCCKPGFLGRPRIDVVQLGFPAITCTRYNPKPVSKSDLQVEFDNIKIAVCQMHFLGVRFDEPVNKLEVCPICGM